MLEPYALKGACTVLRGGGEGNLTSLPDYSRGRSTLSAHATWLGIEKRATSRDRRRRAGKTLRRLNLDFLEDRTLMSAPGSGRASLVAPFATGIGRSASANAVVAAPGGGFLVATKGPHRLKGHAIQVGNLAADGSTLGAVSPVEVRAQGAV